MFDSLIIKVIIPALNEASSIGRVLGDIPSWVDQVIVVDNGSTDATAEVARRGGATVIAEPRRGYGQACLAGMAAIDWCDVVVFLDGDYSDFPEQMDRLVEPIAAETADMVLGRREVVHDEPAFTLPQRFGTALACRLMRLFWRGRDEDMGPFRAIRWGSLLALDMHDTTYGWTVEMQIKALLAKWRTREVPVSYRRRIGTSKISGTIRGVWGAGTKILGTIGKFLLHPPKLNRGAPERLIVFGRRPVPGTTKTRLIPTLGALGAAELHRRLMEHAIGQGRQWAGVAGTEIEVRHAGGTPEEMAAWLGADLTCRPQASGDLGERMFDAFEEAFRSGCRRVVLVGTDIPGMTEAHLREGFRGLEKHDVVLGPTTDGGYWLIGMTRPLRLFDGIPWSTDAVLPRTLDVIASRGLSVDLLPAMSDLDRPEDLTAPGRLPTDVLPVLSVIIPTLNEATNLESAIASARTEGVEIVVADGGSTDDTARLAATLGVRIVSAARSRARQMNAGAAVARTPRLLFLHADTVLPPDYARRVFEALLDSSVVLGSFMWRTDMGGLYMRMAEWAVRQRTLRRREPWGDQALFMRAEDFGAVGGFPDVPIAEDWSFVRTLRRRGRLVALHASVTTSARRWRRIGIVRTFLANRIITLGCLLGVPRSWLAKLYR